MPVQVPHPKATTHFRVREREPNSPLRALFTLPAQLQQRLPLARRTLLEELANALVGRRKAAGPVQWQQQLVTFFGAPKRPKFLRIADKVAVAEPLQCADQL